MLKTTSSLAVINKVNWCEGLAIVVSICCHTFHPTVECQNISITSGVGWKKTRIVWLPDGEKFLKIRLFVLRENANMTDGRTDSHRTTSHMPRLCTASRGKNSQLWWIILLYILQANVYCTPCLAKKAVVALTAFSLTSKAFRPTLERLAGVRIILDIYCTYIILFNVVVPVTVLVMNVVVVHKVRRASHSAAASLGRQPSVQRQQSTSSSSNSAVPYLPPCCSRRLSSASCCAARVPSSTSLRGGCRTSFWHARPNWPCSKFTTSHLRGEISSTPTISSCTWS